MDDVLAIILAGAFWIFMLFTSTGAYILKVLLSVNSVGL